MAKAATTALVLTAMEAVFWHQCWQQNQLGFQLTEPHPLLQQYLPRILAKRPDDCNEIVLPLCGKTPDLLFCQQFLPVQGFELSPIACQDFFREHNLAVSCQPWPDPELQFMHYQAERIQLWQGDFFQVPDKWVSDSALIYDRAALIALPAEMRQHYATKLMSWLVRGAELLVITLEYPQQERSGPPFSVPAAELTVLFPNCEIELLDTVDITGQGFGRRRMATSYLLEKIWTVRYKNGA